MNMDERIKEQVLALRDEATKQAAACVQRIDRNPHSVWHREDMSIDVEFYPTGWAWRVSAIDSDGGQLQQGWVEIPSSAWEVSK